MGLTDREACLFAGVAPSSLYDYCNRTPAFSERKELLKDQPRIKAKLVIYEAIERGDLKTAQWFLERRAKDEFSSRFEMGATVAAPVIIVDDLDVAKE